MSWFQDEMNAGDTYQEVADPWAAPTEDGGYAPSVEDINESVQLALGGGSDIASSAETSSWWSNIFTPTDELKAPASEYAKRQGVGESTQPKQEEKGLIGRITDFANQNKSLTEMVLKGVAGAATAKNASKAATAQMREKDQIERERNAQYSASIAALAKPGIIGRAQPLKRTNGTQVFNNGRIA